MPALGDLTPDRDTRAAGRSMPVRGYTLALSWSPQYCRSGGDRNSPQCDGSAGRFGFILHGLWPEGDGRRPLNYCRAPAPVPAAVARASFCAMPSSRLIAHQWAKHGTCATDDPARYFAAARDVYARVRLPDMAALSYRAIDVGAFKRAVAAANPGTPPSALIVTTERQGDWLRELRICLDTNRAATPCPRGRGRGAPDGTRLRIWRGA